MSDQTEIVDQPPLLDETEGGGMSAMAVWWPVVGASVIIAALSIAVSVAQMCRTYPHDPWESIILADAYRYSVGQPVYTNPDSETGHATHMYGPLMIYAVGALFKWTGINLVAARLITLAASIWVIGAAAVIYFRRVPWIATIAGVAMLMSLNVRLHGWFTQIHPDMPAMGFSVLALILMFQAMEKRRWVCLPLALGSFCVAYLFKQNFAVFTIVPLLSLLLKREWSIGKLLAVFAPPAAIIGLIVAIYFTAPWVHYHMITIVSNWPMRFDILVFSPLRFLGFYILLPVALSVMLLIRPGMTFGDPKMRWLVSAGIGALPGGLLTYSKVGGTDTAFMPALIPLMVLSTLGIVGAWETVSTSLISPVRACVFACLIGLMMMVDGIETTREAMHLFPEGNGDSHYPQVVEYVRNLKGRVICPDDPTIPIVAFGQAGRSLQAEGDTRASDHFSANFASEVFSADFVVVVNSAFKPGSGYSDSLRKLGFVPALWGDTDMGVYDLWRKSQSGVGGDGSPVK